MSASMVGLTGYYFLTIAFKLDPDWVNMGLNSAPTVGPLRTSFGTS